MNIITITAIVCLACTKVAFGAILPGVATKDKVECWDGGALKLWAGGSGTHSNPFTGDCPQLHVFGGRPGNGDGASVCAARGVYHCNVVCVIVTARFGFVLPLHRFVPRFTESM